MDLTTNAHGSGSFVVSMSDAAEGLGSITS